MLEKWSGVSERRPFIGDMEMPNKFGARSWRLPLLTSVAAAAAGMALPAAAADDARVITSSSEKVKVRITGQINRAVLFYDDDFNDGIKHVDNDYSSTRFRWHADAKVNNDIKIGGLMEIQAENNSTFDTNLQDTEGSGDAASLSDRYLEFWVDHTKFGRVYIGKGDPGSNNSSLNNAHASGVIAATASHSLAAGGIAFKTSGNNCSISGTTCVNVKSAISDFDGLTRQNRIRYDTPVFAGFQARASHTDGGAWDASLWYNGKVFDTKIKGAVAYAESSNQSTAGINGDQVNGSLSLQHSSGLGVSFAAGYRNLDTRGSGADQHDPVMVFFGANYDRKFSELGVTSFTGSYQQVNSLAASGDTAKSWQVTALQNIDAAAFEAYASYTHHELDRDGFTFGDVDAVLIGGRIKF